MRLQIIIGILFLSTVQCLSQDGILTNSKLPLIVISTESAIPNEPKIEAHLGLIYNGENQINNRHDEFNAYDGQVGIEIRGNGSVSQDKVSYQFETRKNSGANNNVSLLGLPKENDWILYAPHIDKSLLRNVLLYHLANKMGQYASRTRFCELIINDEYLGVYVLMEKIKRDDNRVNIKKFESQNQAPSEGGYIIKIDSWWQENLGWLGIPYKVDGEERTTNFQYVYPKHDQITVLQKEYIEKLFAGFQNALYNSNPENIQNVYTDYIDINSFVDHFILTELSRNPDGYRLSTFLHKDADNINPLLKIGPVWDYNFGFGNYWGYENNYEGWEYDNHWWEYPSQIPFWWTKLLTDKLFVNTLYERWTMWRENVLSCNEIESQIGHWVSDLGDSPNRNFTKYDILGVNSLLDWNAGPTYDHEVSYLKNWTCQRIAWMDKKIKKMNNRFDNCYINVYPNPIEDCFNIELPSQENTSIQVQLYNTNGIISFEKTVQVEDKTNFLELKNIDIESGVYYLKVNQTCNAIPVYKL